MYYTNDIIVNCSETSMIKILIYKYKLVLSIEYKRTANGFGFIHLLTIENKYLGID